MDFDSIGEAYVSAELFFPLDLSSAALHIGFLKAAQTQVNTFSNYLENVTSQKDRDNSDLLSQNLGLVFKHLDVVHMGCLINQNIYVLVTHIL